jgi:hypothetical protein
VVTTIPEGKAGGKELMSRGKNPKNAPMFPAGQATPPEGGRRLTS